MRKLFAVQGFIYFVTGIWPVLHMPSFLAVTGEKTDLWLVRTVGLLLAVSGAAYLNAARTNERSPALIGIAVGQPIVLIAVDVVYVSLKVIPPVYLADAVLEAALVSAWLLLLWRARHVKHQAQDLARS